MANWNDLLAQEVYAFIAQYIAEHGYAPSIRDISKGCNISRSNVIRYLDRLEAYGHIKRDPGVSRGISLIDDEDSP